MPDHLTEYHVPLPGTLDGMQTVVKQDQRPPRIVQISWGRMQVEGLGRH